ncbi:MAG: hypothetical protein Tsb0010_02010 [Parvularculaceae bacterium]
MSVKRAVEAKHLGVAWRESGPQHPNSRLRRRREGAPTQTANDIGRRGAPRFGYGEFYIKELQLKSPEIAVQAARSAGG